MTTRRNVSTSKEPASIRDVAERASVSISTVSACLNETRPVSAQTRARIMEAVDALEYRASAQGRNLRQGRAGAVGFLVPDVRNPFFMELAAALEEELFAHDLCLVLCPTNFDDERESSYASLLTRRQIDGVVLISGSGRLAPQTRALVESGPVVAVDEYVDGWESAFVAADSRSGTAELAHAALDLGHRKFGMIAGPDGLWSAEERLAGVVDTLRDRNLDDDLVVVQGDYQPESGYAAGRELCVPGGPTVVIAANDQMALGFTRYCTENGIELGRDISVTGWDDVPAAEVVRPGLTTVRQPSDEIGRTAARLLLQQVGILDSPDHDPRDAHILLPTTTVRRGSLDAPRKASA